jgi:N-acetylmuramoyl-L-alanine amidase
MEFPAPLHPITSETPEWSRRGFLRACGASTLALLAFGPVDLLRAATNFEWKIVSQNQRDYVLMKDVATFYRFNRIERDGRHLWLRSPSLMLKCSEGSDELYMNNVKFCLSFPVIEKDGLLLLSRMDLAKLIDPVLRPTYIANPLVFDTVVIDAGHGGHDPGAKGIYGWEKDYALDTSLRLGKLLGPYGLKAKFTRSTDVFLSRDERYRVANGTPKSIFISVHYNSIGGRNASGIETYALSPSGTSSTDQPQKLSDGANLSGNGRDAENIALATAVHAMAIFKLKCIDRGIRRARWTVLTGLQRAGILFEGGFVTSPTECAKINTADYREQVAAAICGGILNYRKALQRRGVAPNTGSGAVAQ